MAWLKLRVQSHSRRMANAGGNNHRPCLLEAGATSNEDNHVVLACQCRECKRSPRNEYTECRELEIDNGKEKGKRKKKLGPMRTVPWSASSTGPNWVVQCTPSTYTAKPSRVDRKVSYCIHRHRRNLPAHAMLFEHCDEQHACSSSDQHTAKEHTELSRVTTSTRV